MSDESLNLSTDYETETEDVPDAPVSPVEAPEKKEADVEANDNISVEEKKDIPKEKIRAAKPENSKTKKGVPEKNQQKSKSRAQMSASSESSAEVSYIDHKGRAKSKKQLERERAFKKTPFAEMDPILADHRSERRALSKRLEEDSEFREKYIKEQEAKRLAEDESSVINSDDVDDAVRTIHKLQGVTDDISEDPSASFEPDSFVDGISNDGTVSYDSYSRGRKKDKKSKKGKNSNDVRAGVYINKLTIKKLVLKF